MCPYHNNFRSPACEVHKEKGLFVCFSCGAKGDLLDLVGHVAKMGFFDAMRLVNSFSEATEELDLDKLTKKVPVAYDGAVIERLHAAAQKSDRALDYIESRGITIASVLKHKIGYSEVHDMITIPLKTPDGKYAGFVGRAVDPNNKMRFKNSKDLERNQCLFNLENVLHTREVFMVEASIDAMRIEQCGLPVVATMGKLSKPQALLANRYFDIIHVVPDNAPDGSGPDITGQRTYEVAKRLCTGVIDMVELPHNFKDAGQMTDDEIVAALTPWYN